MKKRNRFSAAIVLLVLALLTGSVCLAGTVYAAQEKTDTTAEKAADTGWKKVSGKSYYYVNGKKVTGVKKIDGKTYVFASSGALVKNKKVYKAGKKYYRIDKKGIAERFTGVEAMAAKVLLSKKINLKLKKAFKWAAMDFMTTAPASSKKEAKIAKYYGRIAFQRKRGDCYVQAYAFYWMAKTLGYDVKAVRGYVKKSTGLATHAWCEIKDSKGRIYVYDPNFNKEFGPKLGKKYAGYKIQYGDKQTLAYYDAKKRVKVNKNK